jgi:hypothetical protein
MLRKEVKIMTTDEAIDKLRLQLDEVSKMVDSHLLSAGQLDKAKEIVDRIGGVINHLEELDETAHS